MAKTDRSVVRNAAYKKSGISIRERHNERQNESYFNGDIILDRIPLNVHYKSCDSTYEEAFDRMVADGTISIKGLKKDGIKSRSIIAELKNKVSSIFKQLTGYKERLEKIEGKGITDQMRYFEALHRAPRHLAEIVADIIRKPPERQKQERTAPQHKRSTDLDR